MDITKGIPRRIAPDPIIDCNFEIRFTSNKPEGEVIGILLEVLKKGYPIFDANSLPLEVRNQDPNLKYLPEVHLKNDRFQVGLGKSAISIGINNSTYTGWNLYQPEIKDKLQLLFAIPSFIKSVDRIGLRYINFFKGVTSADEVFDSTVNFLNIPQYSRQRFSFMAAFSKGDISITLNAADNATIIGKGLLGSLFDLDLNCITNLKPDASFIINLVETLHVEEKSIFFTFLKKSLVDRLKPEYEGR